MASGCSDLKHQTWLLLYQRIAHVGAVRTAPGPAEVSTASKTTAGKVTSGSNALAFVSASLYISAIRSTPFANPCANVSCRAFLSTGMGNLGGWDVELARSDTWRHRRHRSLRNPGCALLRFVQTTAVCVRLSNRGRVRVSDFNSAASGDVATCWLGDTEQTILIRQVRYRPFRDNGFLRIEGVCG